MIKTAFEKVFIDKSIDLLFNGRYTSEDIVKDLLINIKENSDKFIIEYAEKLKLYGTEQPVYGESIEKLLIKYSKNYSKLRVEKNNLSDNEKIIVNAVLGDLYHIPTGTTSDIKVAEVDGFLGSVSKQEIINSCKKIDIIVTFDRDLSKVAFIRRDTLINAIRNNELTASNGDYIGGHAILDYIKTYSSMNKLFAETDKYAFEYDETLLNS